MKYLQNQEPSGTTAMDRFSWDIGPNCLNFPEIGETITVRGNDEVHLKNLWITSPSVNFDIDWGDLHTASEDHEDLIEDAPDIFESNYFKNGRICSDEWWCWKLDRENLDPFPGGPVEDWALGKSQSVTINRLGELIWRCKTLQALEEDHMYPPVIETTWICKANKVDY